MSLKPDRAPVLFRAACAAALCCALAACGGGGANPLGNPSTVSNSSGPSGQSLSFAYFQYCLDSSTDPNHNSFDTAQTVILNGVSTTNSCSNAGCHAAATGRGGAFRVVPGATNVDTNNPGNTPAVIRATSIYQNFLSAQGETIVGNPGQSLIINKPLLRGVLHGGGQIFTGVTDPNVLRMEYWISNPMPVGEDEFSSAAAALFSGTPSSATCNTLP